MSDYLFADGVGSITVMGGTVRLNFVCVSPTDKDANGQPKTLSQPRLVMTIPGFLQSAGKIQEAVEAISKMGVAAATPISTAKNLAETPASAASRASEPLFP